MHVIRPWLIVGGLRHARDRALLKQFGVGAVLQLAEAVEHPGISCRYVSLNDGEQIPAAKLRAALDFANQEADAGRVVLVSCALGISRSVSVAAALLHEREGVSLLDAVRDIYRVHPEARPHYELWRYLGEYYGQPAPFLTRAVLNGESDV